MNWRIILPVTTVLLLAGTAAGQTTGAAKEFWPKIQATIELRPKTRLQIYAERQNGEDLARLQSKYGVMGSYRMKRVVQVRADEIDDEKNYNLVLGAGFEYLHTNDNGSVKIERRMVIQAVPNYSFPKVGLLAQDRNRIEFRWVNGAYSTRYRNKLTVEHPFKVNRFRFSPYGFGELYHDGQHKSWNQNQYAFGVILPYKKLLSVDTYWLKQNCTTCKEPHVNAVGMTLNIFLSLMKKK